MRFYKFASAIVLSVFVIGMVYFSFFSQVEDKASINETNDCFSNVITRLQYFDGNRGLPIIYLRDTSFIMSMKEEKILHYIKVGDSIVKYKDKQTIYVYRKDSLNKWKVVVFK